MNSRSAASWGEFKNKADKLYHLLFYFAVSITSDEEQAKMIVTEQLFQCWQDGTDPESLAVKRNYMLLSRMIASILCGKERQTMKGINNGSLKTCLPKKTLFCIPE
jgi:hypothetical protein